MTRWVLVHCLPTMVAGLIGAGAACREGGITPPDTSKARVDLSITKTANRDSAQAGDAVVFTIRVTNNGPITATSVTGGDTLPTGMTYAGSSTTGGTYTPSTGFWTIGSLERDSVRALTLNAIMGSGTLGTWRLNRAGVLAAETDSLLQNNVAGDSVKLVAQVPPQPGDSEPVDPGSGYVWADNMDRYTSVASMSALGTCPSGSEGFGLPNADVAYGLHTQPNTTNDTFACNPVSFNGNRFGLVSPGRGGAGKGLRCNIQSDPTHQQQSCPWNSPWMAGKGLDNSTTPKSPAVAVKNVFQVWFRFSVGGTFDPLGTKWFEWWGLGAGNRTQAGIYRNGGNTDFSGRIVGEKWHINPYGRGEIGYQPVGPYPNDLSDGNWHRYTIFYQSASTSGASDGIVRVWVDGKKVVDVSAAACGTTPPNGTRPWCNASDLTLLAADQITNFQFPGTMNGADVGFTLDLDDLKWWVIP